jgi:hypothetical protein
MPRVDPTIILLIEDDPTARGAPLVNDGKPRQLEYACVAHQTSDGQRFTVKAVRDTNTHEIIYDTSELPPLDIITEAVRLYDWSWINQPVFDPGLPMVDGTPFKARAPEPPTPPRGRRRPRRKDQFTDDQSPDDRGEGV